MTALAVPAMARGASGEIAYSTFGGGVTLVNADATNPRAIAATTMGDMAWSPDGTTLVGGIGGVALVDPAGSGVRYVPGLPSGAIYPSFSPDGRQVVFSAPGSDGMEHLFIAGVDGSGERQLTFATASDSYPSWSRSGTIVFQRTWHGGSELCAIGADGTQERQLTSGLPYVFSEEPAVSPDGTRIAYVELRYNGSSLVTTSLDGTGRRSLVSLPYLASPAWSPDGSEIVFESSQTTLDIVEADGSWEGRLLDAGASIGRPAWRPVSQAVALTFDGIPHDLPNRRFAFTATVASTGEAALAPTVASFHVTGAARVVAAGFPGGGCTVSGALVSCSIPPLAGDSSIRISFVMRPTRGGTTSISGSVAPPAGELETEDDSSSQSTHLAAPKRRVAHR